MNDRNESSKAIAAAFLTSALCWLLPTQAAASDVDAQKPQIAIEKSYVKISLVIDTDLKPFAKLFANCLAEGKAWADKTYGDATAEWRDNRKAFRGLQWFYDREYTLRSIAGPYVSVVRGDQWFDGGAHPNQHIDTILWDDSARKRVSIRPFFTETTDNGSTTVTLAQLAKLAVASAKLAKDINGYDEDSPAAKDMTPEQELQHDTFINDGIKPNILGIGPVTLAPSTENGKSSGLTFHYSPYDVGPYVEGPYTVFVPWTKFRQYLSPEGMMIFGGERPKGDGENW
jgi:Protein of unknown function (DUF3298)